MRLNKVTRYFEPDGTPTEDGIRFFYSMERRLSSAEGKLAAIAAVADPSGGATQDAEARTAIIAIIDGAG